MDYRALLANEQSKEITTTIVNDICKHPEKMDDLMQIFIDGHYRLVQRAAWPFSFVTEKHPALIEKHYDLLIKLLDDDSLHQAVSRNILRALQFTEIPEKYEGKVLDRCFEFLNDNSQPIAIKAFSMTVVYNLSKKYPDIVPELKASIEALLPDGSAGIKSRGRKILNALNKI